MWHLSPLLFIAIGHPIYSTQSDSTSETIKTVILTCKLTFNLQSYHLCLFNDTAIVYAFILCLDYENIFLCPQTYLLWMLFYKYQTNQPSHQAKPSCDSLLTLWSLACQEGFIVFPLFPYSSYTQHIHMYTFYHAYLDFLIVQNPAKDMSVSTFYPSSCESSHIQQILDSDHHA